MSRLVLSKKFEEALLWTIHLHSGQLRKGTNIPYFSHLLGVASLVMENTVNEDVVIAALLHDAVEDSGGIQTLHEIERRFGKQVAEIVEGCSDTWEIPKPPSETRKANYIKNLPNHSESVHLVSLSDKIHNARSILIDYQRCGETLWDRFNVGKEGTLTYYRALVLAFQEINNSNLDALVQEFNRVVTSIETNSSKR